MAHESPETGVPLTVLAEDEQLFYASVLEFADQRIRPLVREMDEHAKVPRALLDELFELGVMGIEIPEAFGGGRRQLLPLRAGRRGAVPGRPVDRRPGRRPEHARRQRAAPLGHRRREAALPAGAGGQDGRRLRAVGGRVGQRRLRHDDAGGRARRRLRPQRAQALDHQRQRGRHLHRLRQRQPRGRLPRHHGVPRRARRAPGSPSARRKTSWASAPAARASCSSRTAAVREGPTCSARSARATRSPSRR